MAKDKETGKDKTRHILTAAGEPLPIDPETGNIIADDLTDEQREILERAAARMVENAKNYAANLMKPNQEAIKAVNDALQPYIARFNELSKQLASVAISPDTREIIRDIINDLQPIQDLLNEIDDLKPYIVAELKKDEYGGMTLDDIVKHTPAELLEMRRDPGSLFYKAIEAARAERDAAEPATIKRADIIEYPLDKPNSYIWNLLEKDTRGQIKFDMLPKNSQLQATAIYSINFDELSDLQITKRLTPYDKRVYIAVSALYNAGNNVITLTQIYYAMGYTGNPGANDLNRINEALTKMTGAKILFDNQQEAEALKKYKRFKYDGSLLPFERLTAVVNGQMTNAAIRIFREPPLMTFAKQRQQITSISVKLLQSPVSKTDANLQIDDYLLERIGRAKRGGNGHKCRILYKTLFERTGTTQKKQKQRAPGKIKRYLDYYKEQGYINSYSEQPDGITVFF